jgi:hypothetical protein
MPIIEDPRKRAEILDLLTHAYWMEIETVMNYISHSVNLDGVRAEEIKKSLAADVTAEIGHAQLFARRIKTLSGLVPGSFSFRPQQATLQPNGNTTDVVSVIGGASTPSAARSSTTPGSSRRATASTTSRRTWSSRCWPTSRITCASSRAT